MSRRELEVRLERIQRLLAECEQQMNSLIDLLKQKRGG